MALGPTTSITLIIGQGGPMSGLPILILIKEKKERNHEECPA
jgi:hypothetical protein